MSTYHYYTTNCAICDKELPKRDMNKIYISFSHSSVTSPKLVCSICDECLPTWFDDLGVSEPDREIHWGKPCSSCPKCWHTVNKKALYCPYCREKLKKE